MFPLRGWQVGFAPFEPPARFSASDPKSAVPAERQMALKDEKREVVLKVRATATERERWQAVADAKGVTLSDLVRLSLDGQKARRRAPPPSVAPELLRALAGIGNNLNQLSRAVNRKGRGHITAMAIISRLVEIDRELAALRLDHERRADAD